MAAYRMTPARAAALKKAQAASARKRKLGNKSRTSRLVNRKTLAVAAVGGVVAGTVAYSQFSGDSVNDAIINRHVELARLHHTRTNYLRSRAFPMSALTNPLFDEEAARLEARAILKRKKKKTV